MESRFIHNTNPHRTGLRVVEPHVKNAGSLQLHHSNRIPKVLFTFVTIIKNAHSMARTAQAKSIDSQITSYVSGMSEKNKKAVLTVVKSIAEAEAEAEFEKKWSQAIPLDEAFQEIHDYIKTLKWKK